MSGLDVTPKVPSGRQLIQSYGNGGFRIGGVDHRGSVLVFSERTVGWPVADAGAVGMAALADVVGDAEPPRILIIGCGARFTRPPSALTAGLREHGIALEWMDTGAACRTFNVLLTEERPVAAALIAVD